MVINNHSYEEQTRRLLSEARSELVTIEAQIKELQEKVVILAREVDAYETALQGFLRRSGKRVSVDIDWKQLLTSAMTHKDRIRLIAEHSDGIVKASQATDILYTKGFINSKKRANAYQIVQTNLAKLVDDRILEKVQSRKGEYRLIGTQQPLPSINQ